MKMLHITDISDKQILHGTGLQIDAQRQKDENFAFRKDGLCLLGLDIFLSLLFVLSC